MTGEKKTPSLEQFAFQERIRDCTVCALPLEAREGITRARKKRIPRDTVLAWLKSAFDWQGSDDELTTHANGHHDRKLKELEA